MKNLQPNKDYPTKKRTLITIVPNGDSALTLLFDKPVSEALSREIIALSHNVSAALSEFVEEMIPAYQSLTICYRPTTITRRCLEEKLWSIVRQIRPMIEQSNRQIEIPVCYDQIFAPDMMTVAEQCQLSIDEIIRLHTQANYLVHMLGFSPGFMYLGGLNSRLYCDRKAVPENAIEPGSVGIGGQQTGVYPQSTPGGWQIIGRTPIELFNSESDQPFVAKPLDKVKFIAISPQEYDQLRRVHR